MRIVVDPGALSKPGHPEWLDRHLAASLDNKVILTDFAMAEAFNTANAKGLQRTFAVIARYPAQIEVLKTTGEISRLPPGKEGLAERFLDEKRTNQFRVFCHDLVTNAENITERITRSADHAGKRVNDLLASADAVRADMKGRIALMPAEDLGILRKEGRVTAALATAVRAMINEQTSVLFREFSGMEELPDPRDAIYSFPQRFALANLVLNLRWGIEGGLAGAAPKTIRNDVTDMSYVAYATLYDGLITADGNMETTYRNARRLLAALYPQ